MTGLAGVGVLGVGLVVVACAPPVSARPAGSRPALTTGSPSAAIASANPVTSAVPSPGLSPPSGPGGQSCADLGEEFPCLAGSTSVEFVSAEVGWVVGPEAVLATTTGGRQWRVELTSSEPLLGSDFLNAEDGWVVGSSTLYRTTDGGGTWQSLGEPSLPLWSVHFVSPLDGWGIVGGDAVAWSPVEDGIEAPPVGGRVVVTTDGGQSWRQLSAPSNAELVCFPEASQGWLGVPGAVYRSEDGGVTWRLAFSEPEVAGLAATDDTFLECASPPAVWVYFHGRGAALSHMGYASVATADGIHWQVVLDEPYIEGQRWGLSVAAGPGTYPGPFSVVSSTTAVYLGFTPPAGCGGVEMVVATQGGAVLAPGLSVPLDGVTSAAFLSPTTGWVVGTSFSPPGTGGCGSGTSEILATADGGGTWSEQYAGQL